MTHPNDERPGPDSSNQPNHSDDPRSEDAEQQRHRDCGDRRSRRQRGRHHHGRKERVLHTRISEQLSEDIRRLAEDLRVPASNLVRNVLEEVFTMVETVSEDVGELFEEVLDEAEAARGRVRERAHRNRNRRHRSRRDADESGRDRRFDENVERELRSDETAEGIRASEAPEPEAPRPRKEFPDVLGWQPLVLNRDEVCASCEVALPRGARAFVGLGDQGLTRITLCRACTGVR